jgi:hypothetical protein
MKMTSMTSPRFSENRQTDGNGTVAVKIKQIYGREFTYLFEKDKTNILFRHYFGMEIELNESETLKIIVSGRVVMNFLKTRKSACSSKE